MGRKVKPSNGNWMEMEKEEKGLEYIDSLLSTKTVDDHGHFDRQNVKFKPETVRKCATVVTKRIRPEAKTIHDLIRGYVDKMVDRDLQKKCESESELSATIRKVLTVSHAVKEEHSMLHTIEQEIKNVYSDAHDQEESRERLSQILLTCPSKIRQKAKKIKERVMRDFIKGKNKQGVLFSSIDMDDEDIGDNEQVNL